MTEKWTPGPWTANQYVGDVDSWFVRGAAQERVCGNGSGPVVEANARLIAAAPDLYRELDMQVRNCPVCKGEGYAVDVLDILTKDAPEKTACNRCKSARTALSRARGE